MGAPHVSGIGLCIPYATGGGGGGPLGPNKVTFKHWDTIDEDKVVHMDLDGSNPVQLTVEQSFATSASQSVWVESLGKWFVGVGQEVWKMDKDGSNLTQVYTGADLIRSLDYDPATERLYAFRRTSGNGFWGYFDNLLTTFDWTTLQALYRGNVAIDFENDRYWTQIYDQSSSDLYEKVLSTDAAIDQNAHGAVIKCLALDVDGQRLFVADSTTIKVYDVTAAISAGPVATVVNAGWSAVQGIEFTFSPIGDRLVGYKSGSTEIRSLPASLTGQNWGVAGDSLITMSNAVAGMGVATIS